MNLFDDYVMILYKKLLDVSSVKNKIKYFSKLCPYGGSIPSSFSTRPERLILAKIKQR